MPIRGSLTLLIVTGTLAAAPPHWSQFRGPNAGGVAESAKPPVHFGPETNLLWKVAVPPGISAPIVWGDYLFLTAHERQQLVTLAYDARTGRELWRQVAPTEQIEECHRFSSPAASTPCTDGERVYAYFGSYGLLAYDFAGKEIWRRPLERLPSLYGTATSPIAANGYIYVVNEPGTFTVIRAGDTLELAAVNKLGESVRTTPAITGNALYVRSADYLWAFGDKPR